MNNVHTYLFTNKACTQVIDAQMFEMEDYGANSAANKAIRHREELELTTGKQIIAWAHVGNEPFHEWEIRHKEV